MSALPLAGRRILVTRAAHQAGKLSEGLRALGAEPVEVPVLEIRFPESIDALDAAIRNLNGYDWLIVTSANTVRALAERAMALGFRLAATAGLKVAAVGEATAAEVKKIGFKIDLIPKSYVAESLVAELAPQITCRRVLLARAAIARDLIPDALCAAGAQVDVIDAYRNVMPETAPALLKAALVKGIEAATFTSSSSVTHLAEAASRAGIAFPLCGISAISIGPITSKTLRDAGWEPAAEANPSDIRGLVAAVAQILSA
jgi:uroporphyrinogen-III synthase